jgi:hypothetical protein
MPNPNLIILLRVVGHPAHMHDLLFIRPTASTILFVPTKIGACLFIILGICRSIALRGVRGSSEYCS